MRFLLTVLLLVLAGQAALADSWTWLGKARLFTNDRLGDGQDRWRTGSYAVSYMFARDEAGGAARTLRDRVELRFRTEIVAPANLQNPVLGTDRPYAGILGLGVFSHLERGGVEAVLGVDLVVTGPQTGLGDLQSWVHNMLGMNPPQVLGSQIGNGFYPALMFEVGRTITATARSGRPLALRPFLAMQAGFETYLRAGLDLTLGGFGPDRLFTRDVVTGQRNMVIRGRPPAGTALVLGGDVAWVADSVLLPRGRGYALTPARLRLRTGFQRVTDKVSVFYGLTWLGREFVNQPEGQAVGALTIRARF